MLTPAGSAAEAGCDSIVLTLSDGGLIGIQTDHAPAVLALAPGAVRASLRGQEVLRKHAAGGFASVKDNVVTVVTESAGDDRE